VRLALLLAAPVVLVALFVSAVEAWRLAQPQSSLFVAPRTTYSLGEAIAEGKLFEAYDFVRAGQNPNDLIAVSHEDITAGESVLVSPLVWAVANRQREMVQMLLGHGARIERPADTRAICLARALGSEDIVRVLTMDAGQSEEGCRPLEPGAPPLLRVLADTE
jgi:hypothetical protein